MLSVTMYEVLRVEGSGHFHSQLPGMELENDPIRMLTPEQA